MRKTLIVAFGCVLLAGCGAPGSGGEGEEIADLDAPGSAPLTIPPPEGGSVRCEVCQGTYGLETAELWYYIPATTPVSSPLDLVFELEKEIVTCSAIGDTEGAMLDFPCKDPGQDYKSIQIQFDSGAQHMWFPVGIDSALYD